jgi:hypothetical protein
VTELLRPITRVVVAVLLPITSWLTITILIWPNLPSMLETPLPIPWALLAASLILGFRILRKVFPRHPLLLGVLYFPIMLAVTLFVGLVVSLQTGGSDSL